MSGLEDDDTPEYDEADLKEKWAQDDRAGSFLAFLAFLAFWHLRAAAGRLC